MHLATEHCVVEDRDSVRILHLVSADGTNKLTRECVLCLSSIIAQLEHNPKPMVIAGNEHFFSVGADLKEIASLRGTSAYEFSRMGQELMNTVDRFPAPVIAAVRGYCMGGGLDLVLACDSRVADPHAIFGHRGAALGLITGWGGTQRLPRLVGKARAIQMFAAAEKLTASRALDAGLVQKISTDPLSSSLDLLRSFHPG